MSCCTAEAVGVDITLEQAREAARYTAVNALGMIRAALGSLDEVVALSRGLCFVLCPPGFTRSTRCRTRRATSSSTCSAPKPDAWAARRSAPPPSPAAPASSSGSASSAGRSTAPGEAPSRDRHERDRILDAGSGLHGRTHRQRRNDPRHPPPRAAAAGCGRRRWRAARVAGRVRLDRRDAHRRRRSPTAGVRDA